MYIYFYLFLSIYRTIRVGRGYEQLGKAPIRVPTASAEATIRCPNSLISLKEAKIFTQQAKALKLGVGGKACEALGGSGNKDSSYISSYTIIYYGDTIIIIIIWL